jgi:hypothetical protein
VADKNQGSGEAADAGVVTTDNDEEISAKAQADLQKQEAKARVDGAKARVDKLKQHLAGAEDALAEAIAAQKEN